MTTVPLPLENVFASILARRKEKSQFRQLTVVDSKVIDFSSNSYLSLSNEMKIRDAYVEFLKNWLLTCPADEERSFLGSGGSRLLDGNSKFAETLEHTIAAFHGAPTALLFNSGFDANVGLFATLPQPGDFVIYDELIHASVHDGMRLSRARQRIAFRHNTVYSTTRAVPGQLPSLDALLDDLTRGSWGESIMSGKNSVFIAVEAIYSMDGDVSPLRDIVASIEARLPNQNGYIIVDEAHSTGVRGKQGRGLVCELGLENKIFARLHTFGKAMGCSGAAVLCSSVTREYLVNYARTFIYTTAMALPSLASVKIVYEFLARGDADHLISRLEGLIDHTYGRLQALCIKSGDSNRLRLLERRSRSPIIPLLTSEPRALVKHCQAKGFMVRAIMAPTVPLGMERVRICLHAANSMNEIDDLCQVIDQWLGNTSEEASHVELERRTTQARRTAKL